MSTYQRSETGFYFITEMLPVTSDKEIDKAIIELKEGPSPKYCASQDETGKLSFYEKVARLCEDSEVPQARAYVDAREREQPQPKPRGASKLDDIDRLLTMEEIRDKFEAKFREQSRCNHKNVNQRPCDLQRCGVSVRSWLTLGAHRHPCNRRFNPSYLFTCEDCGIDWKEPGAQTCDRHAKTFAGRRV